MLSRQRSTCFLLDPPRVKGLDFVEMLRLIGYPGADGLKGEDFDWLSEGNEEAEVFLGWLCGIVDQRNVLTDEQLAAYDDLRSSGKPLFEKEELQKLCSGDGHGDGDEDMELELEEHKTLDELEEDVQSLKNLRSNRLRIRNKCESLGFTLSSSRLSIEKFEKQQEKNLIHIKENLAFLNSRCNATLANLGLVMKDLDMLHRPVIISNIFLSSLNIADILALEENCLEQIHLLSLELLPGTNEEQERKMAQQEMEMETERVRTSWVSQRMKLSMAVSTLYSKEEALGWFHKNREVQSWDPQRIPLLEREIQSLEAEVEILQTQRVPALVSESSIGPCLSSQKAWIRTEKRKQERLNCSQLPLTGAILYQLSRLQFLEMGLYEEQAAHVTFITKLGVMAGEMTRRVTDMARRLQGPRDHWVSAQMMSPIRIVSKDHTAVRLAAMLSEPTKRKDLFPKYEVLGMKGASLLHELTSLRNNLKGTLPQISSLETECEKLSNSLLRGSRNLQLRDPALTHSFEVLYGSVSQFNQWCLDCLRDLDRKKHSIQTSRREQERKLYVLFYKDPALLASTVQELEQRVQELMSA